MSLSFGSIKIGDKNLGRRRGREDNRVDVREDRTISYCSWFVPLTCE